MRPEAAYRRLRDDPGYAQLIHDSYLDLDTHAAAERFAASAEFQAVSDLLGERLEGATVLDLGAGNGIASAAFARAGAERVFALEPDPSSEIGRGAIEALTEGLPVDVLDGIGEEIPLSAETVDIVYARQVLHHARDLEALLAECARVLRARGMLIASREHVVDDDSQLEQFLDAHPVHRFTGGEFAYSLDRYVRALTAAGMDVDRVIGPWDSVINAFPTVTSDEELETFAEQMLRVRLGRAGDLAARSSLVRGLAWRRLRRATPGRLYTFVATKRP